MKNNLFIILVLSGLFISILFHSPNAKFQGRMIVNRLIDKIETIHRDDEEKKLYETVLKVKASDIYRNRDLYKRLSELNPSLELYKKKLKYYQGLIDGISRERKVEPVNRNKDFIDSLISRGAISIDKQFFKIYVESEFWNAMDYPTKNTFCMAVNNIYDGYLMVDRYSGKTLANSNRLGEINITH